MTTEHTPGPWTLGNQHGEVLAGPVDISINNCGPYGGAIISRDEVLANVHLIMAAPDLLMTLERLVEIIDEIGAPAQVTAALIDARIALKRARGAA